MNMYDSAKLFIFHPSELAKVVLQPLKQSISSLFASPLACMLIPFLCNRSEGTKVHPACLDPVLLCPWSLYIQ